MTMRLIDAHKFVLSLMGTSLSSVDEDTILDLVDGVDTVDAVPVVRCKDCRDYDTASGFCRCHSQYYDSGMSWDIFREDDFCSYGERMDGDAE